MIVIIAGIRTLTDFEAVCKAVSESGFHVTEVVSGGANGADSLGERWARRNDVPVRRFPADWNTHGKAAGPIRNRQMAWYADALIALWDGNSRGTGNMIAEAKAAGIPAHIHLL